MSLKFYTGLVPVGFGLAVFGMISMHAARAQTLVDQYNLGTANGDTTAAGGIIDSVGGLNGTVSAGTVLNSTSATTTSSNNTGFISLPTYDFAAGAYTFAEYLTPTTDTPASYPSIFSFSANSTNLTTGTTTSGQQNFIIGEAGRSGTGDPAISSNDNNDNSGGIYVSGHYTFNANILNQYVATFTGADEIVYVNGNQVAEVATTNTPGGIGTGANAGITTENGIGGNTPYSDTNFSGNISQFDVYQGQLSAVQVQQAYSAASIAAGDTGIILSTPSGIVGNGINGLTDTIYHLGTATPDATNPPTDAEITTLLNNVDSGAYNGDPGETFTNTATNLDYAAASGKSGDATPTNTFLGSAASGAAATDTTVLATTLINATGYIDVTTPGVYYFANSADDGARITINGQDVSETNYTSAGTITNIGPGQGNNVDFTTAGLYSVDIFDFNQYSGGTGGASFNFNLPVGLTFVTGLSAAPEPSQVGMLALMALGLGGLLLKARKRGFCALA